MRSGKRTQDFHFIKTERDALYYAAEIPSSAWGPPKKATASFKLLVADSYSVSSKEQEDWFKKLRKGDMFAVPYLIMVSSEEDDSASVAEGYDLMKIALNKRRVQITGSSGVKEERTHEESVFMLTNVYEEAPEERVQSIRDWCYRHKECFRVICASGDPSVIQKRLRLKFNALFYLESSKTVEYDFG